MSISDILERDYFEEVVEEVCWNLQVVTYENDLIRMQIVFMQINDLVKE